MSDNTAIRITEQPDGTWEVCQYDTDRGPPPYPYSMSAPFRVEVGQDFDHALDIADGKTSEYGLEIVRLKDREKPADIVLAEAAQKYAVSLLPDSFVEELPGWCNDIVTAFIQGAGYQQRTTPVRFGGNASCECGHKGCCEGNQPF